jgi:endonuclease G, mitochondrial
MRFLILAAALLLAFLQHGARADAFAACGEHLPFGTPTVQPGLNTAEICHAGYAALVDQDALVPRWVAYRLTGNHTLGCFARQNNFHPDEGLPATHRARPADYAKSGYDIGHQAPAADFAFDTGEMSDSFALSNMAPQLQGLNRQGWEFGEATVRAWAVQRGDLLIYVGPVLHGGEPTIGPDRVAVPSMFWKVVVDLGARKAVAWEMPQRNIAKGDLTPFLVSIDKVEADAQIELPMPAAIDKGAAPELWAADLSGWEKAHKAACGK